MFPVQAQVIRQIALLKIMNAEKVPEQTGGYRMVSGIEDLKLEARSFEDKALALNDPCGR
ncbi:MAG: hypothetical protein LBR80_15280 [Deltaproteobacteria bacterium]|nr:hypothetical protein [Deltaproteobacteria bacterium]